MQELKTLLTLVRVCECKSFLRDLESLKLVVQCLGRGKEVIEV